MSIKDPLIPNSEKWNQMLLIVNQHRMLLQLNVRQQLKKLFLQRLISENILVFIIQYIGLNLGTFSVHTAPMWFATGTSCAYLFLRGYTILPGIWLGTFSAYLLAKASFFVAMGCATVFTIQAILLLWFCHHFLSPTLIFYRLKKFIIFILYTILLTGVSSYLLLIMCYTSLIYLQAPLQLWLQWWLANFNGILVFSCAFISFDAYFLDIYATKQWKKSALIFGLLVLLITALVFSYTLITTTGLTILIVLLTFLISLRFGWYGSISAALLLGIILCFADLFNSPLYSTYSISGLQVFLCVNTFIGLCLSLKSKANSLY